jgi:glycosyltransferase involved in cell wall biosynthesis
MRTQAPFARPRAIEPEEAPVPVSRGELLWSGHISDRSGYAKANREIAFRCAHTLRVQLISMPNEINMLARPDAIRLEALAAERISDGAPMLRFYTPLSEYQKRYRIIFTMMETESLHPEFVKLINDNYAECWTPTAWGKKVFEAGGVHVPIFVMPLGVNPHLFRPEGPAIAREAILATQEPGKVEAPRGFTFVTLYQPTFRKNIEYLVRCFDSAFRGRKDVSLVLATTVHGNPLAYSQWIGSLGCKARVYVLAGNFEEWELADMYRSCGCFVTATLGEGWNLPLTEAAACGLPVIAPSHSAHLDFLTDNNAYLYSPDGVERRTNVFKVCHWYEDQLWPKLGKRAAHALVDRMVHVEKNREEARENARSLTDLIRTHYTWDRAAGRVVDRVTAIAERE